ncbi:MAG: hypothetical protein EXR71_07910 [Myxococcales bacterium]|nr:hypothetical protein [Myxococcales bacterium]
MPDDLTPGAEARLDQAAVALLSDLPDAAPGAATRVARRLARSVAAGQPQARSPRYAYVGGGLLGAALAAAALFAVPAPVATPPAGEGTLQSEDRWAARAFDGVALSYRGVGDVDGTDKAPRIDWQRGTLNVEVTPDRGLDVRISTREAEVRVVGTGFTVDRTALGTRVDVRHGLVETRCGDSAVKMLGEGDSVVCPPRSAAGLLGRAQALRESGSPPDDVVSAINSGLVLSAAGDPVADELLALQVRVLADAGRPADALAAAERLIASGGGARRGEVLSISGQLAALGGGCATAAPWLAAAGADASGYCQ